MLARPIAVIAMSLLLLTGARADGVKLIDSVPHIATVGDAKTEVVPDIADIMTGVTNERPTAQAATEATAKAAEAVVADIKAQGIDPRDITTSFVLNAKYESHQNDRGLEIQGPLRGYEAFETIQIHLRDVGKAGALARELIDKGANAVGGISFGYSKEEETRRELRAQAMRDALARARAYTDAIGLTLGRVLRIGDDPSQQDGVADMPSRRAGLPPAATIIPVEPGVMELEEQIGVMWEIEGKAR